MDYDDDAVAYTNSVVKAHKVQTVNTIQIKILNVILCDINTRLKSLKFSLKFIPLKILIN